jgi:hypothetical protein
MLTAVAPAPVTAYEEKKDRRDDQSAQLTETFKF